MAISTLEMSLPVAISDQPWPEQGQWTYDDYLRLPDDGRRYEIIGGVLYMANAPSYDHQYASLKIASKLDQFATSQQLGIVLAAPFEVHLPGIAKPVQPDVLFIRADRQPKADIQLFTGAPDLIVEVLSPSSLRRDQHIKFGAYEQAGVREYWIADPKTRSVIVYSMPENGQEYLLLGQFTAGETIHSQVLAGLEVAVDGLFL